MPARDGTGPLGQGSRTGHGMGACGSTRSDRKNTAAMDIGQPFHWGGRIWDFTVGRLLRRNRTARANWHKERRS